MLMITGGAGYIGSHTTLELLRAGHEVVILDNLVNSRVEAVQRLTTLAGRAPVFVRGDVRDRALLDRLFQELPITGVLHFAGLKAVGESVQQPLRYYENNVAGSVTLCQAMAAAGVFRLVFSSSATVYGEPPQMPIREDFPTGTPTNPYGRSKLMVEEILRDLSLSESRWNIALLRYFNPVGAHPSGLIGEDPQGIPNNLLPYISQVAVGKLKELAVFALAYNLVRSVMAESAAARGVEPERISLADTVRWLIGEEDAAVAALHVNPARPGRFEPRVVKRRPKQYRLMNRPRAELRKALLAQGDAA